jgi:hypothetical protein
MAGASAGFAQDKPIKPGGSLQVSGAVSDLGLYFDAQETINRSGASGYRFSIQYESATPQPLHPVPQQAAPVRTKREARRSRSQPPQPSPKTTVGK